MEEWWRSVVVEWLMSVEQWNGEEWTDGGVVVEWYKIQ